MTPLDRINIDLLGKRRSINNESNLVPQDKINEHMESIIKIFYDLLENRNDLYYKLIPSFNEFVHDAISHINDMKDVKEINMEIDSIHEEDTELDVSRTNRLMYMPHIATGSSNKMLCFIRKIDGASHS